MSDEFKQIRVVCPVCNKQVKIDIPVFIVDESQEGVAKVQIPQGACCPDHAFMAFVDKKFKVRGYQNVDIEFNVDRKEKPGDQKKVDIKNYSVADMVDIIGPDICATILRVVLVHIPILLLETYDLYEQVEKMVVVLRSIGSEELPVSIEKVTKDSLPERRKHYHNFLILVPMYKAIIQSPFEKNINTRFESSLLREAIQLPDPASQTMLLRKEMVKVLKVVDDLVKVLRTTEKLYEEEIPGYILQKFNIQFDVKNIDVIRHIIEVKYDKMLATKIISKFADFLT